MTWIKAHKMIFIVVIVVVVAVVWYGLSSNTEAPLLTTTAQEGGTLAEVSEDQEIVGSLLTLRAVTLSGTIFSDPAFLALKDFGTTLVPEPAGRPNPFAPLSGSGNAGTNNPSESAPSR